MEISICYFFTKNLEKKIHLIVYVDAFHPHCVWAHDKHWFITILEGVYRKEIFWNMKTKKLHCSYVVVFLIYYKLNFYK